MAWLVYLRNFWGMMLHKQGFVCALHPFIGKDFIVDILLDCRLFPIVLPWQFLLYFVLSAM